MLRGIFQAESSTCNFTVKGILCKNRIVWREFDGGKVYYMLDRISPKEISRRWGRTSANHPSNSPTNQHMAGFNRNQAKAWILTPLVWREQIDVCSDTDITSITIIHHLCKSILNFGDTILFTTTRVYKSYKQYHYVLSQLNLLFS